MKIPVSSFRLGLVVLMLFALQACNDQPASTEQSKQETTVSPEKAKATILFFGNSLTAAFGVEPEFGFVNRIQQKIDSLDWNYTCVNAGNTGETTHGGLERLDWVLKKPVAIMVLELGANDGLRGLDPASAKANLIQMIKRYRAANPDGKVLLLGMMAPPSMGEEYTQKFNPIYAEIVEETGCAYVPFLLDNVAGDRSLNLPDGIHPTPDGHAVVAETVWKELKKLLTP